MCIEYMFNYNIFRIVGMKKINYNINKMHINKIKNSYDLYTFVFLNNLCYKAGVGKLRPEGHI